MRTYFRIENLHFLIDELKNIKKLHSATAIVNVKKDSFFVHTSGEPVMPGTYSWGFGQAVPRTAAGIDKSTYENKLVFLTLLKSKI